MILCFLIVSLNFHLDSLSSKSFHNASTCTFSVVWKLTVLDTQRKSKAVANFFLMTISAFYHFQCKHGYFIFFFVATYVHTDRQTDTHTQIYVYIYIGTKTSDMVDVYIFSILLSEAEM